MKSKEKLNSIEALLNEVCEDYGSAICSNKSCDGDPGWENCLTRKILGIIKSQCRSCQKFGCDYMLFYETIDFDKFFCPEFQGLETRTDEK